MTSLYQIAAEYRQQLSALADLDMPPEVVADTVEGMAGDVEAKLRAVIAYSLELDILATGASDAAKRMQDRAKALQSRVEWLRTYALQAMQGCGIGEVATEEFAAKLAKKPASVNVIDATLIPPAYMRTPEPPPPAPDKKAIGDALKAGASVPGCELVQGYRLAIK
jgi:Siphovirus Gp157